MEEKRKSQIAADAQKRLKALRDVGREPTIDMIDPKATWDASEAAWIERLTAQGHDLLNVDRRI